MSTRLCTLMTLSLIALTRGNSPSGHHDDILLKWVQVAEENLKIYIYPIPDLPENSRSILFGPDGDKSTNILAETFLIDYFYDMGLNGFAEQKAMVVTDPEIANVFLINHHWMQGAKTFPTCMNFYERHLLPILDSVIINQPYFNRSNGNDHFILFMSDNGLFVDIFIPCLHQIPYKTIVRRLYNVSQISNYAKDIKIPSHVKTHSFKSFGDGDTFIIDKDITIPQSLDTFGRYEKTFLMDWEISRPADSAWHGWVNGDRKPNMHIISTNASKDYTERHFEKFLLSRELENAYFAYNPCGLGWCWSRRLYDGLSLKSIPVFMGSNIIMPFEKFLPWEKMSVKISATTWHNMSSTKFIAFRRRIRQESEKFRNYVDLLWQTFNGTKFARGNHITSKHLNLPKAGLSNESISLLKSIHETNIYSKMMAIHRNFGWLYWNISAIDHRIPWKHPFKLIQLEMWCRVSTHELRVNIFKAAASDLKLQISSTSDLCLRPSNKISELEYF